MSILHIFSSPNVKDRNNKDCQLMLVLEILIKHSPERCSLQRLTPLNPFLPVLLCLKERNDG